MIDRFRFADWLSAEAKSAYAAAPAAPPPGADIAALRAHYDAYNRQLLDKARAAYPVDIAESRVAGVPVHVVTPPGSPGDGRTLLCLHGGAFMWGSGAGALLEAVPLAADMGCRVVAVDYRLAPEHVFPAAVDDVLAVYADTLTRSSPRSIGIYGCSAGGMLTAQSVAAMLAQGMPTPGAVGMFHGAGVEFAGDSALTAGAFDPRDEPGETPSAGTLPYFAGADLADPLVMPGNHPAVLAGFPPTLLVSGTRDFAASACSVMHRRLLAARVDARFVLFGGLWHAHHMDVGLPETRETYALIARFFDEHLQ